MAIDKAPNNRQRLTLHTTIRVYTRTNHVMLMPVRDMTHHASRIMNLVLAVARELSKCLHLSSR